MYSGLALSVLDPSIVVLTDLPEVIPLLQENIQLNILLNSSFPRNRYFTVPYVWGTSLNFSLFPQSCGLNPCDVNRQSEVSNSTEKYLLSDCEVMILSDVVYDPSGYALLVHSIFTFLSDEIDSEDKCCILAHKHRHPESFRYLIILLFLSPQLII